MLEKPFFFVRVQGELHQIGLLGIYGLPLLEEEIRAMGDAVNKTISGGISGAVSEKWDNITTGWNTDPK